MKKLYGIAAVGLLCFSGLRGCGPLAGIAGLGGDSIIGHAFEHRQSGVSVTGEGTVVEVLPDDRDGSRHQRFILKLGSGRTLLIAHNIDLASRIPALKVVDRVIFRGVYEWNPEGGVIHWTHDDPSGRRSTGWVRRR